MFVIYVMDNETHDYLIFMRPDPEYGPFHSLSADDIVMMLGVP
jgi:hypothetical protein